ITGLLSRLLARWLRLGGAPWPFSCSSPRRFGRRGTDAKLTPILPPGRLRLVTRPVSIGSPPLTNTIGMVEVAARATRMLVLSVAATWSLAAHAQESGTLGTTKVTPAPLPPQIEVARVKPLDRTPPNLRLSDDRIDLMSGFSLSSAQAIGGAWGYLCARRRP